MDAAVTEELRFVGLGLLTIPKFLPVLFVFIKQDFSK